MSNPQSFQGTIEPSDLLARYVDALLDGGLTIEQHADLCRILAGNPDARVWFVDYMQLHASLTWEADDLDLGDTPLSMVLPGQVAPLASPVTLFHSPLHDLSGWPVAYLIAAMVLGIGALIGSFTYVSQPDRFAQESRQDLNDNATSIPTPKRVGQITEMQNCKWSGPETTPFTTAVCLNQVYALASGLLEITYDSGAKVILQGPVTYEVDSADGGYLSGGKLTARVETGDARRGARNEGVAREPRSEEHSQPGTALALDLSQTERGPESSPEPLAPSPSAKVAGGQWPVASESRNPQIPKSQNPSLSTIHHPLFTVRTPSATITDLGTEFGVEVHGDETTTTRVYVGRVQVEGLQSAPQRFQRVLTAGEAVQLGPQGEINVPHDEHQFVRHMPHSRQRTTPDLIGQIDYSDTWSANSPIRPGSYLIMGEPSTLRVEDCHGNPPRSWLFSTTAAMTTSPWDGSPVPWPGHHSDDSKTGMCETGSVYDSYMSIEYGLRDDFIVQFDAVQTTDRINISIGDDPATIAVGNVLSVFFRQDNHGTHPAIGLHTPERGEVDAGIPSGIAEPWQWHNYAVRFNIPAKTLTIWVDRQCRGAVELAAVETNTEDGRRLHWADVPLSNRFVTVGGSDGEGVTRIWTDSFRVGSPGIDPEDGPGDSRNKATDAAP